MERPASKCASVSGVCVVLSVDPSVKSTRDSDLATEKAEDGVADAVFIRKAAAKTLSRRYAVAEYSGPEFGHFVSPLRP
jgi:hypothetical protein